MNIWSIKKDPAGLIWVRENGIFRIWDESLNVVEDYLAKFVNPKDILHMKGFKDETIEFTGEQFLKEYNETVKALPSDEER